MKMAGIVGGTGPESTIEYYRQIIAGYKQRRPDGSSPSLLINSIDVQKVLGHAAARENDLLADYLAGAVRQLARGGAEFALMAANTPHIVFDDVQRKSPIPMVSIVDATCKFAMTRGLRRLGLFGTRSTMQAGFYQEAFKKAGLEIVLPSTQEQDYIHEKYVGELLNNIFLTETRARLLAIVSRMKKQDGTDGLVLGGTELPLLLRDNGNMGVPFLDTTQIHVSAALDVMLE